METILTLALARPVEACNTIDQQLAVKRQDHQVTTNYVPTEPFQPVDHQVELAVIKIW